MKKLSVKILDFLESKNNLVPNKCQVSASQNIEKILKKNNFFNPFNFFIKKFSGIYIQGSIGVGKSLILKALHVVYPKSEIFHFTDLIFHLQSTIPNKKFENELFKNIDLILIDEFYINNLTNLILFKKFLDFLIIKKKKLIMTGNKNLNEIYFDPINEKLCLEIRLLLEKKLVKIQIKSKIDYRSGKSKNHNFFFIGDRLFEKKQNILRKHLVKTSLPIQIDLKRPGNSFSISGIYGNILDNNFSDLFSKNLVFQDYQLISKKWKIIIIRDVPQMSEDSKNLASRFISFIDIIYENKNVLSLSTRVKLNQLYLGKTNVDEFKRTISRLKEIGSNSYIKKNLKN